MEGYEGEPLFAVRTSPQTVGAAPYGGGSRPCYTAQCVRGGPHAPLNKAGLEDGAPRRRPHGLE